MTTAAELNEITADLRYRIVMALTHALLTQPGGYNSSGVATEAVWLADAVLAVLGDPETQWSTVCDGHRYIGREHTARYRARSAGHQLETRLVAVIEDWHALSGEEG